MNDALRKVMRYTLIYGPRRTAFKVLGRSRKLKASYLGYPLRRRNKDIGLIGCGQYAFSSIGYILLSKFGRCIHTCFDPNEVAARSLHHSLDLSRVAASADELITSPEVNTIYIASNHASHTEYAIKTVEAGKHAYVEKPLSVSKTQFFELELRIRKWPARFSFGYNRPFSAAIRRLRARIKSPDQPLSFSCFISGHQIPADHWYRDANEGTRICGNAGHWIDLLVNLLALRGTPREWHIFLTSADDTAPDDNISITLKTDYGDIANIFMTSRCEPFEGISESISIQWGEIIAKIEDFRKLTIWEGPKKQNFRYYPKDIGHADAILQPFNRQSRDATEVIDSTWLMLEIAEMVTSGHTESRVSLR